MPLTVQCLLFDVQNEGPGRVQHSQKLFRAWQEPVNVVVWMNAAVSAVTGIRVRWAGYDQIDGVSVECLQFVEALAREDNVLFL